MRPSSPEEVGEPQRAAFRATGVLTEDRVLPGLAKWVRHFHLEDGTVVCVRPGTPEDADLYPTFIEHVSPEDMRLRFFGRVKDTGASFIERLTQFDRAYAMAFIGTHGDTGELLGVARLHADAKQRSGEFAVIVRTDFKGRGLGPRLVETVIDYGRAVSFERIEGQVLVENASMLAMCQDLGFSIAREPGEAGVVRVSLDLIDDTRST